MLTAAGNINRDYEVIGIVHAFAARTPTRGGCGKQSDLPVREAYEAVTAALQEAARNSGGNGLIHVGYDHRMAVQKIGCNNPEPVFEVYGWGTAIKLATS